MNFRLLLIAVLVFSGADGSARCGDNRSPELARVATSGIDGATLDLLERNRVSFDQSFRDDTGIDGAEGIANLLRTLNQRKLKFLELSEKYGQENFAKAIQDLERYRESLDGMIAKLDRGEFEVVVFFKSPEIVGRILKGESAKNYFETGATSGSYDVLARAAVEASFVGLKTDDYLRSIREDMRPKYGILRLKGEPVNQAILRVARCYGAHALVFDGKRYIGQMTFSLGDSFDKIGGYLNRTGASDTLKKDHRAVCLPDWSYRLIPWQYRLLLAAYSLGAFSPRPCLDKPNTDLIPELQPLQMKRDRSFGLWYYEAQIWGRLDRSGLVGYEYYRDAGGPGGGYPELSAEARSLGVTVKKVSDSECSN